MPSFGATGARIRFVPSPADDFECGVSDAQMTAEARQRSNVLMLAALRREAGITTPPPPRKRVRTSPIGGIS